MLSRNKSNPGLQSDKRLGWKKPVSDLSSILFIKLELHCGRFALLRNSEICFYIFQKQLPRGVLSKRCSENTQQFYRRTPTPKGDFSKVAATLLKPHFGMGILLQICYLFSEHLFRRTHLWTAASGICNYTFMFSWEEYSILEKCYHYLF